MSGTPAASTESDVPVAPIPVIVVDTPPTTPPNEKKEDATNIQEYLEDIRSEYGIPIYNYNSVVDESVMCALVPPRLEEVFADHRFRGSCFSFYPHVLLVRDCMPAPPPESMTWWQAFWSEDEVKDAVSRKNTVASYECVNEAHEYSDVVLTNVGRGSCQWRSYDMADSFNRGCLPQRHYDLWLWWSFYRNPHDFPTLGYLVNMVRIKQLLWGRYSLFFNATTLCKVYPENELAKWVWDAYQRDAIAVPEYRDDELSYEVRSNFFVDKWPKRIRSYEDEVVVQRCRKDWHDADVKIHCGQVPHLPKISRRIFNSEELPKCMQERDDRQLAQETLFWKRRHNPVTEQHDAEEPNYPRWRSYVKGIQEAIKATIAVGRSDDDVSDAVPDDEELLIY